LIADIGEYLGCGAYVTALRRTCVAGLPEQMTSLSRLQAIADARENKDDYTELDKLLLPLELAVQALPMLTLPQFMAEPLTHGVRQGPDFSAAHFSREVKEGEPIQVRAQDGRFLGVAVLQQGLLVPKRMMSA
ncbi:MAG: tRNA pseudouridine(55) synthase TruB, partial [Proteobacteria bacterium]|nr:tRNA pseudouridine(55) synthase TruB [Candidatus Avisuccinivibrio stercorigallinarum]